MIIILLALVCVVLGQPPRTCEFTGGPGGRYTLNLTSISGYRLEYRDPVYNRNYYFTPCRNGEQCQQGNAQFYGNCVEYQPGSNMCLHYLAIDHHERPDYFYTAASWAFMYQDGEKCDLTQQPRDLNVFFLCDELLPPGAVYIADVYEYQTCRYSMQIRTGLACVDENSHHANCQWAYRDYNTNNTYFIDLSSQKGKYIRGPVGNHGYEQFYSPCQNGLHCFQQTGQDIMVQSILENTITHTCEMYLSAWEEGRFEPTFHNSADQTQIHWDFHYFLSQPCQNGQPGEETIRWYCDPTVANNTLINATYDGDCRHEMNIRSSLACPSNPLYTEIYGVPKEKLFRMNNLYKNTL
jgi:hypothetical protein